jgi:hypothetical protein
MLHRGKYIAFYLYVLFLLYGLHTFALIFLDARRDLRTL